MRVFSDEGSGDDRSWIPRENLFTKEDTVNCPVKRRLRRHLAVCVDHADTLEERPDSGRSVLRKRNISDRGSDDGGYYCTGNESFFYGGGLDESGWRKSSGMTRWMRQMIW